MAKTKPTKKEKAGEPTHNNSNTSLEELYAAAISSLEISDLPQALKHAEQLLAAADPDLTTGKSGAIPKSIALPALNLLGEICVELGEQERATQYFLLAVNADPDGTIPDEAGGGAEKFLWLAQLSEEGGADSVKWFQKGVAALKTQVAALEANSSASNGAMETGDRDIAVLEKRAKIATALCGVSEIYMTDLSWDENAEQQCEALITEALMLAPENAEVLQTVASVRLSQLKVEDAQSALRRSLGLWKDLDPEDDAVPDFSSRISLARLLMEAELEVEAMEVLQRLAMEDDQSVEACYLGGWCLNLLADKRKAAKEPTNGHNSDTEEYNDTLKVSRTWLLNTLRLYDLQQYEDDKLKAHTLELVDLQNKVLGPPSEDGQGEDEVDWDEAGSSDEEMS